MSDLSQDQIKALSSLVDPERFSAGPSNRELHICDVSVRCGKLPVCVIWPIITKEAGSDSGLDI
jgi:hypothetical protein